MGARLKIQIHCAKYHLSSPQGVSVVSERHLCLEYFCSLGKGGKGSHGRERMEAESSRRHTGFVAAGVPARGSTFVLYFLHWRGTNPRYCSVLTAKSAQEGLPTVLLCVGLRRFLEGKTFNSHTRTVWANRAGRLDSLSLCGHLPT